MSSSAFVPTLVLSSKLSKRVKPLSPTPPAQLAIRLHPIPTPQRTCATPPSIPPSPPAKPSRILLWLQSDLRISDNAALVQAAQHASVPGGALIPLRFHTVDPIANSIASELAAHLSSLGSTLLNVLGNPEALLPEICNKLHLHAVYYNRHPRPDISCTLHKRVTTALQNAGIHVEHFDSSTLPTTQSFNASKSPSLQTVAAAIDNKGATTHTAAPDRLPHLPPAAATIKQVQLPPNRGAGTSAAMKLLAQMTKREENNFSRNARCELVFRLKPHLDYGSVSPRMVAATVFNVMKSLTGRTYEELVWRTFLGVKANAIATRGKLCC
ncbi:Deoxyribodipyrimidine photo-lyase [Gracilariopsis chorda]|uniref:Deoxyribodipyrimidine photo-lyase n=1 Tax=Gracilariopsis chorda TaxID=448386 RepID=A0A2V3J4I4_9FLOR|nr:Deoxyribodipyrimidine photo-lyase [Gracilariopsis chorda]|eukprot:PXF49032.1 Deoxyribodipyrimidine photo-lyase [Gracilariopsis chorda]